MKFKPVTKKYSYESEALVEHIPDYLHGPISEWIVEILRRESFLNSVSYGSREWVDRSFINRLNVLFREQFPQAWSEFILFIFNDTERIINFLAFCLQNFAFTNESYELERILSEGGSAWAVTSVVESPQSYAQGVFELTYRVPELINKLSEESIQKESLFRKAWIACYSRNPDYEKVVSKSVDAIEGILRDKYFPKDSKPVLTKFIQDFLANPVKLSYKGDTLISPKNLITDIAKNFIVVRGQHTKGTGRVPTKEEAEFVLHYCIFLWNINR